MKNRKRMFAVLLLALALAIPSAAQESALSPAAPFLWLQLNPAVAFGGGSNFVQSPGADVWMSLGYRLPFFNMMFVSADVGMDYFAITQQLLGTADGMLFVVGGGLGFDWRLIPNLNVSVYFKGGGVFPSTNATEPAITGVLLTDLMYAGGVNISYLLSPSFGIGIDAAYRGFGYYYSEIAVAFGLTYNFYASKQIPAEQASPQQKPAPLEKTPPAGNEAAGGNLAPAPAPKTGTGLQISRVELSPVFPVFAKFYDENRIGKATIHNWEKVPVENIKVNLIVKDFMTEKKPCKAPARLEPGEEGEVDLYALFTDAVLKITQGTKALANISVEYTLNGQNKTAEQIETIRFYDRNALTWDDDRKAAAFVTAKDTSVLVFSNNVNSMIKSKMNRAVDKNLQTGIAFHDALRLYGVSYVSNPLTPYSVVSKDKTAIDTVKFPRQTFEFKSGDCSDLSILYCALLESVQIETAFITIPGHIFMAFALKAEPNDVKAGYTQSLDNLIIREGKVWVPVEVTERDKTFLDAWQEGAKEWRENLARDQAGFFPLHAAWKVYEPVYYPSADISLAIPDAVKVVQDFQNDVTHFVEVEIFSKKAELQAAITKTKAEPKSVNALGVLYARYDMLDSAEREFQRVLANNEYLPALTNLGNLYYLKQDWDKSLSFYDRAFKVNPKDPKVLLGEARVNHELQNYGMVKKTYDALKTADPDLAGRFGYLDLKGEASTRAAETSGVKDEMIWSAN